jgi:hypothetical protein
MVGLLLIEGDLARQREIGDTHAYRLRGVVYNVLQAGLAPRAKPGARTPGVPF